MRRKQPFSGKAKKQQLHDKRKRIRQRIVDEDESPSPTVTVPSRQRDLRTVFQNEPRNVIEARKRDSTRALVYAPDRGNSQSIYNYSLHEPHHQPCILVKPKWAWGVTTAEELVAAEDRAYREWIEHLDALQSDNAPAFNLYERNIEVWRQLWRTIERSDVLVHLADARCPLLHISDQLVRHIHETYPHKRVFLVLTKADLVSSDRVIQWENFLTTRYGDSLPLLAYNQDDGNAANTKLLRMIGIVASTIDKSQREVFRHVDEDTLTIGFVGEPNVGKSSLLNSLFERKLVSVSSTPGHTKHLQTHYFEHMERLELSVNHFHKVIVCDCPGVVFPRLNVPVALQILFGSFPIAQTREPFSAIRFIAENCDPPIHEVYKLKPVEETDEEWSPYTLCESYAKQRGFHIKGGKFDINRAANQLLRDTLNGKKVVLSFPPPH